MIPEIVAHLWQSTLFAGAAWLIALSLRTNRAQVRYWVWFAASAKFLIPFSLLVGLGTLVPHPAAAPAVRTEWMTAVQEFTRPLALPTIAAHTTRAEGVTDHGYLGAAAWALWACGFVAVTISWSLRWRRVHALRRSARAVRVPTTLEIPVPVMSAPGLIEPGVFGILRPVLLLPECIAGQLTETQLDAILSHEFCHVRRRDNLTAAIHMAAQAIFWFHPLTWWIGTRLVDERERACDEEVLRHGCRPNVYAESILVICKLYLSSPLACVSGVTGSNLKRRIESIMINRGEARLNLGKKIVLGLAGTAALALPVVIGILNAPAIWSQQQSVAPARPQFEVASLKPNNGCENTPRLGHLSPSPGRLEMPCVTLQSLIQSAYGTFGDGVSINAQPLHTEGGPSWMRSEHYSLSAKSDGVVRTEMLAGPMLQALLEERFRLRTHRETREVPVYAMTVGKGGLKVQPLAEGSCTPIDLTHPPPPPKPGDPPPNLCGTMMLAPTGNGAMMMIEVRGSTMTQFAQRLSGRVDRTVVDKTGIPGKFNFRLEFAPDRNMPGQAVPPDSLAPPSDAGPSLFVALQEQIGVKLSSDKGPVSFLIVDHVEKPTPN